MSKLKLRRILKDRENQNSISISLTNFPKDKLQAADIFFNFSLDMNMQLPETDITLQDVYNGNLINSGFDSFSFLYKGVQYQNDPWNAFLKAKPTLCLKNTITGISFPIESDYNLLIMSVENIPVYVDGIKYYDFFKRARQNGDVLNIEFGKSSSLLIINKNNQYTAKFNYQINGNLNERITDTCFLIDLLSKHTLTIGNRTVDFPFIEKDIVKHDLNIFRSNLILLKYIKKLMDTLNVKESLDLDNATNEDFDRLAKLINVFLLNGTIKKLNENAPDIVTVNIVNISVLLVLEKINDISYKITNFFDENSQYRAAMNLSDEEVLYMPKTFFLNEDHFKVLDNINYDLIRKDIKQSQISYELKEQTYFFIKRMINGYKKRIKNKTELNSCIKDILCFLKDNVSEFNYDEILKEFF